MLRQRTSFFIYGNIIKKRDKNSSQIKKAGSKCKQFVNSSKNVSQNRNFAVIEGRRRIDALSDVCYNKGGKEMLDRIEVIKIAFLQIIQRRFPLLFRSFRPLMRVKTDFNVILKLKKGQDL